MNKKMLRTVGVFAASAMLLTACGGKSNQNTPANIEVSIRETVYTADPQGAVDAIYTSLSQNQYQELDGSGLQEYYNITLTDLTEFVAYRSDAKNGLCDIAIIKPTADKKDAVREHLYAYKDARIEEFRNYNLLDAYEISQNAVIFDQGDYVVLLMLPDNEAAQDLLDEYIPQ